MDDAHNTAVPVWALASREVPTPSFAGTEAMTAERLGELRSALAAFADSPIATLEAHPAPADIDRNRGLHLGAASPLAKHLAQLISQTPKASSKAGVGTRRETLYRMVIPAKVATQVGGELVKPMASKTRAGGVRSALVGPSGIAAHVTFTPVAGRSATAGAAGGSAATAGVAAAGAGTLTVAAPLVLMAVAVGVSAHADQTRQQSTEKITGLLQKLHANSLDHERVGLNGCRAAIEKANALLLDKGKIGAALGLGPAVYAIDTAVEAARLRLMQWRASLDTFNDRRVELPMLREHFVGVDSATGGEFRAQLELAELAIALKKRVMVLQAVEHAQTDPTNPLENFTAALQHDQKDVLELESGISDVLRRLSALEVDRGHGPLDVMVPMGKVDELLRANRRLRAYGDGVDTAGRATDVAIEMLRNTDGSVVVLPAHRDRAA